MGFQFDLDAGIEIFHREPPVMYDAKFNQKARGYNLGFGFVLRKHQYPFWYVGRTWVRAFGGMCVASVSLNWPKMRYHYNVMVGRVLGYLCQR